jgi:hypothetical protein
MYATVFNIFKFELNPLDNKKDISLYVLFRTFSVSENFLAESVFFLQNRIFKKKIKKIFLGGNNLT